MNETSRGIWRFGPFVPNQAISELTKDVQNVAIEPQSLRLLSFLIDHRERVVSRADLVEAIWQGRAVSDWAISGAIKAVRSALGDLDVEKRYVRTVHSRGYRFVADIASENTVKASDRLPTILVRIFRTQGNASGLEYLAEGLADDLITNLSRSNECVFYPITLQGP